MDVETSPLNEGNHKDRLKGRRLIIPVFVPHMGCPHACRFCDQRTVSGQKRSPTARETADTILSYAGILENYGSAEVAFYGGSFTAIPSEQQTAYLRTARAVCRPYEEKTGRPIPFRVSTRPDAIDRDRLALLRRYGVEIVELGAQSMCEEVLAASGRGHTAADTVKAAVQIREAGMILGIQTMPGLPESDETKESFTAEQVIALRPSLVRIYPTIVFRGTALADDYENGRYRPLSTEEAVSLCAGLVPRYEAAGIKVIRLGLQSSEAVSAGGEILAGPYHPAFGELVYSRILRQQIGEALRGMQERGEREGGCRIRGGSVRILTDGSRWELRVPAPLLSAVIGQHRCNLLSWQTQPACRDLRVRTEEGAPPLAEGF